MKGKVYIGTSGYHYAHWQGVFYPEELSPADWLSFYQQRFATVEINRTFYRLPSRSAVERWVEAVPAHFVFAVKASRYITHMKRLKEPEATLARFIEVAESFGKKAGPLLYQLPPRWRCNPERLVAFCGELPDGWRHTVEVRDADWYREEVRAILADHGVGFCLHDYPGHHCPGWVTAGFVYVRRHGPSGPFQGSYSRQALGALARRVEGWTADGLDVYVYFNNDPGGHSVANALYLQELCRARSLLVAGGTPAV